jgi:hypothetical protein
MLFTLTRLHLPKTHTPGKITWPGETEGMKSLECPYDPVYASWPNKPGWAIPFGMYELELVASPTFASRGWYKKAGNVVVLLKDVPGNTGVLIHVANYVHEIKGCIAPGYVAVGSSIYRSTAAYLKIVELIRKEESVGNTSFIEITQRAA